MAGSFSISDFLRLRNWPVGGGREGEERLQNSCAQDTSGFVNELQVVKKVFVNPMERESTFYLHTNSVTHH